MRILICFAVVAMILSSGVIFAQTKEQSSGQTAIQTRNSGEAANAGGTSFQIGGTNVQILDELGVIIANGSPDDIEMVKRLIQRIKKQDSASKRNKEDHNTPSMGVRLDRRLPSPQDKPRSDARPAGDAPKKMEWTDDRGQKHEIDGSEFRFTDQSNRRSRDRDLPESVLKRLREHDIDIDRDDVEVDVQVTKDGKKKYRVKARKRGTVTRQNTKSPANSESPAGTQKRQRIERRVQVQTDSQARSARRSEDAGTNRLRPISPRPNNPRQGTQGRLRPSQSPKSSSPRRDDTPRQESRSPRAPRSNPPVARGPRAESGQIEKLALQIQRLDRKIDSLSRQIERLIQSQDRNRR